MPESKNLKWSEFKDVIRLGLIAVLVTAFGLLAFTFAEVKGFSPNYLFVPLYSLVFLLWARRLYRHHLRSRRFQMLLYLWLAFNAITLVFVLKHFGWLWLVIAAALEQFFFQMSIFWMLGVVPPDDDGSDRV